MNILVLGASEIFKKRMLGAIEKINEIECVDVASLSKSYNSGSHSKIRNIFASYEEALTRSDADLVYVSVRNHEHVTIAKQALLNDKHVIIDKPAALDISGAQSLVELAAYKNRCVAEALVYQYHPQIHKAKELFQSFSISSTHISVNFTIPGLDGENFRYDPLSGGGAINDMASYAMTIGEEWFEMPLLDCVGFKKSDGHAVETAFSVSLAYEGNKTLSGFFGFETEYTNAVTFFGKGMSIHIDRVFTTPAELENNLYIKLANQSSIEKVEKGDAFKLFLEDVLKSIDRCDFKHFGVKLMGNAKKLDLLKNKLILL